MRIAIIHDWLTGMRGGERCLEVICKLFPGSDIFTAFYDSSSVSDLINQHRIFVSPFNYLYGVEKYYRYLMPFFPAIAKTLGVKLLCEHQRDRYDLVISVSHCLAKNVSIPEDLRHVCYCLTPMRYIWDQYPIYFANNWKEPLIRMIAKRLQVWDRKNAKSISRFIAISSFIGERIKRYYEREAEVIYPPVDTSWISPRGEGEEGEGFLCVSALVPYKNVELIVKTFNNLPHQLTVVGRGPEGKKLRNLAKSNIRFLDFVSESELAYLYRISKAMVFAAEEDFGMTPVEMQAAGRPVICLGRGGALETVSVNKNNPSGILFAEGTEECLRRAVEEFIVREKEFTVANCTRQAKCFSLDRFEQSFVASLDVKSLSGECEQC